MEVKLMDCIYENFDDKGIEMKQTISDFEQLLINERILKDNTGKSYRAIFEEIASDDNFNFHPSQSFMDLIMNIPQPNSDSVRNCQNTLLKNHNYDFSKGKKLQSVLESNQNSDNFEPSNMANGILKVLDENDFELDYYKFRTFLMLDLLNSEVKRSEKLNEPKMDISNALKIYIDEKNKIFVEEDEIIIKELKPIILKYYKENKSNSVIALKTTKETMYREYIEVQNEIISAINTSRENLSKERFNEKYIDLTIDQKNEIDREYPNTIVSD